MNTVPHARAGTTLKTPAGPLGLTVDDRTHHASSVLVAPAPEAAMQRCPGTTREAGRSGGQPRIVLCSAPFFPFGNVLHLLQQTQPSQGFCRTILPTPHLPITRPAGLPVSLMRKSCSWTHLSCAAPLATTNPPGTSNKLCQFLNFRYKEKGHLGRCWEYDL